MELNVSKTKFITLIMEAKTELELIGQTMDSSGFLHIERYSNVRSYNLYYDIVLNISEKIANKILKDNENIFNIVKEILLSKEIDHYLLKINMEILEIKGYKFKEE